VVKCVTLIKDVVFIIVVLKIMKIIINNTL